MKGIKDFLITERKWPDGRETVTCEWSPNGVVRETETIDLPDVETLAACARARLGHYDLSTLARAVASERASIVEALARRVAQKAQRSHWSWSGRVLDKDEARFYEKTRLEEPPLWTGLMTPCRVWTAATSTGGNKGSRKEPYGSFRIAGSVVRAHIFAGVHFGVANKIPHLPGMHLDHLCRNTLCVEWTHLESVTQEVNEERKRRAEHACEEKSPEAGSAGDIPFG